MISLCSFIYRLTILLNETNENEVIVLEAHKSNTDDIQMYICKEDEISEILPAILCPSFKKEVKLLKKSDLERIKNHIIRILDRKSVVLKKNGINIAIYSVFSSTLKFHHSSNEISKIQHLEEEIQGMCEIQDWFCKPKRLNAIDFLELNYKEILSKPLTKNVNFATFNITRNIDDCKKL